jgi:hypothetical protein
MMRGKVAADAEKRKNDNKRKRGRKGKGQKGKQQDQGTPKSNVEKLAKRIDDRFYSRMPIILDTRIAFVNGCREYALKRGDGSGK